jgi:hypothetical protein
MSSMTQDTSPLIPFGIRAWSLNLGIPGLKWFRQVPQTSPSVAGLIGLVWFTPFN